MVSDDLEPDPVAAEDSIDLLGDDYTAASSVVKDNSKKPFPTPYFSMWPLQYEVAMKPIAGRVMQQHI